MDLATDYKGYESLSVMEGAGGGGAAKLSVGLVGGSPITAILSWQCSYIRQWLK